MNLWLTREELIELTGYKTKSRWRKALSDMNVSFRSRPLDGFPLVPRSQFENTLTAPGKRREPRWDLLS